MLQDHKPYFLQCTCRPNLNSFGRQLAEIFKLLIAVLFMAHPEYR